MIEDSCQFKAQQADTTNKILDFYYNKNAN